MAAARSNQLEDLMSCGVCMEKFDDSHVPKLLPCQHTFCEVCIHQSTSQNSFPPSLDCPVCRCKHVIPQGGFVTSRQILDIVEELMRDTTIIAPVALKCKKHSNKDVVFVCIDCLDVLCNTCVKSSVHLKEEHHIEEVDEAAPALQQKFKEIQRSHEKKLSMLEESHCSSTEMAKAAKDITSFANKLHAEINQWESEQLAMLQEMSSFVEAQEREIRSKLNTLNDDIETLLRKIQQAQSLRKEEDDEDFLNNLQQRKTAVQNQFAKSLKTLLDKITAEIESKSTIQSAFLKQVATSTSVSQGSRNVATWLAKDKDGAQKLQPVMESKIPKDVNVLYKVRAIRSREYASGIDGWGMNAGDVIAVTGEGIGIWGPFLTGINIATGHKGEFRLDSVEKIQ